MFLGWACAYYHDEEGANGQRGLLKKLTRPRDERHRLKGLYLIIWTPDFFEFGPRNKDGEWLGELFAGLALHQPCWDEINICLLDMTAVAAYSTSRIRSARLLYGLGRLHAKTVPDIRDEDMAWCMYSPEHKYPLLLLHDYLGAYFDVWTPMAQADSQIPLRREELMGHAPRAAESHDEEGFFALTGEAVDHVQAVFRQCLDSDSSEPDDSVEALGTAVHRARNNEPSAWDMAEKAIRESEEQGRQLISAKDRKWRATYRPKRRNLA